MTTANDAVSTWWTMTGIEVAQQTRLPGTRCRCSYHRLWCQPTYGQAEEEGSAVVVESARPPQHQDSQTIPQGA